MTRVVLLEDYFDYSRRLPCGKQLAQRPQIMDPVTPRQLNPLVNRDLETICLKCLSKEPSHRYASAAGLEEDLTRYLDGIPTLARPVGVVTRTCRWLRRRPAIGATLALAVSLVLLLAIGGPWWALRESKLRRERDKELARATVHEARLAIKVGRRTSCPSIPGRS